jgi:hypothetical protein
MILGLFWVSRYPPHIHGLFGVDKTGVCSWDWSDSMLAEDVFQVPRSDGVEARKYLSLTPPMSAYIFELPTTGSITFADILIDKENKYAQAIANATSARANVRAVLKASKRAEDSEKDYLRLVKVGH